jgi:hypothetical protein
MRSYPIQDLKSCSVRGCESGTEVIIQKTFGTENLLFGYCQFHAIISTTFFQATESRVIIGKRVFLSD